MAAWETGGLFIYGPALILCAVFSQAKPKHLYRD